MNELRLILNEYSRPREKSGVYYIKEVCGLHVLWGENKNLFVPFLAMVSVVVLNNLNDCGIATDTRCRWGCRWLVVTFNFQFLIFNLNHLIHPAVVMLHTLEAPFAE